MSTEKLAKHIGRAFDRRGFLGRLGAGAVGVVGGMFGFAHAAKAAPTDPSGGCSHNPVLCCCLCYNVPVPSTCSGPISCTWTWTCCSNGWEYMCVEGFTDSGCHPPQGECHPSVECSGILPSNRTC